MRDLLEDDFSSKFEDSVGIEMRRNLATNLAAAPEKGICDKHDIVVTPSEVLDFGRMLNPDALKKSSGLQGGSWGKPKVKHITIKNSNLDTPVRLKSVVVLPPRPQLSFSVDEGFRKSLRKGVIMDMKIPGGENRRIYFRAEPQPGATMGEVAAWLCFMFEKRTKFEESQFTIVRRVTLVNCDPENIVNTLDPEAQPYYPVHLKKVFECRMAGMFYFRASVLPMNLPSTYKKCPAVRVPAEIEKFYAYTGSSLDRDELIRALHIIETRWTNHFLSKYSIQPRYSQIQRHLAKQISMLWAEDVFMELHIRKYDRFLVHLEVVDDRGRTPGGPDRGRTAGGPGSHRLSNIAFWLTVPGVGERQPALTRGAKQVELRCKDCEQIVLIPVTVAVQQTRILLWIPTPDQTFYSETGINILQLIQNSDWHARFYVDRRPMFHMLRAITRLPDAFPPETLCNWLFPSTGGQITHEEKTETMLNELDAFDSEINEEQWRAVLLAMNRKEKYPPGCVDNGRREDSSEKPFVIFGPPGTGKTKTVIEIIRQTAKDPSSRILVCTPSDFSSDVILMRLADAGLQPSEVLRLNSPWRHTFQGAQFHKLQEYTLYNSTNDSYIIPSIAQSRKKTIVICTCIAAGYLVEIGLTSHFTHLIFDEAAQAMEPESYIPLLVAKKNATVILCGDHYQLGPVTHNDLPRWSEAARTSLLERLMKRRYYSIMRREPNNGYVKLVQNYRSHQRLLDLPNRLFYENDLRQSADPSDVNIYEKWKGLPNQGFPFVFHGVLGRERSTRLDAGSYYNPVEITKCLEIVGDLLRGLTHVQDIGIICPYWQQVLQMRTAFRKRSLESIEIGVVDDFQGREKKIIIISTCVSPASNRKRLGKRSLLGSSKRFNVAITRAEALLIVVGHPHVLKQTGYWAHLLNFALTNRCYIGDHVEIPSFEIDTVLRRKDAGAISGVRRNPWQTNSDKGPAKPYLPASNSPGNPFSGDAPFTGSISKRIPSKNGTEKPALPPGHGRVIAPVSSASSDHNERCSTSNSPTSDSAKHIMVPGLVSPSIWRQSSEKRSTTPPPTTSSPKLQSPAKNHKGKDDDIDNILREMEEFSINSYSGSHGKTDEVRWRAPI